MTVSAQVMAIPGIETASAVMASATNVANLAQAGLGDFDVRPNDLVVAVSGTDEACDEALARADELLSASRRAPRATSRSRPPPPTSIQMAVARDPAQQPGADLGAGRLRRGRGHEGPAAGHGRHALQRQRDGRRRARAQDLRPRARPDGHGPRLRHRDRQRRSARIRQRGPARTDRRRRRFGNRHPGGDRPGPPARVGDLPGARHRRPRPVRDDRRHLHAARPGGAGRAIPAPRSSSWSPNRPRRRWPQPSCARPRPARSRSWSSSSAPTRRAITRQRRARRVHPGRRRRTWRWRWPTARARAPMARRGQRTADPTG